MVCHSLRGECGLKSRRAGEFAAILGSLSARRVWIEILFKSSYMNSLPLSLSARRVWIEIVLYLPYPLFSPVTLCEESVD